MYSVHFKSLLCFIPDIQEAQIRGSGGGDEAGGGLVVPLLLQNAPPILEGRKDDELADLELRPEQVRELHVHVINFINCHIIVP